MNATLIAVDIGNSRAKAGWFDQAAIAAELPRPAMTRNLVTGQTPSAEWLDGLPAEPIRWRVVSVNREGLRVFMDWVHQCRAQDELRVLTLDDMPLTVRVDHPDQVGPDRLAAAVAANALRAADRAAVVVSAGTALTINVVGRDGAIEGGVILAGFRMQAEALFQTADLLPLAAWKPGEEPPVIGKNSEAAIQSGLFWGAVGAVREIVGRVALEIGQQPQVFVTGGDLARLAPLVGEDTRFVPNLVLGGIAIASRQR
jgi:type III pantothenate kinase